MNLPIICQVTAVTDVESKTYINMYRKTYIYMIKR
ncbi:hypothetical protein GGD41_005066 [Paraburkholderia bryophila]|uniref:Uncharacterized protein n=1 Tax=Paraburkholderia bryophila TaxID=420952 RepID=A0A7Z0B2C4_9BURK|nr:hypothetical protein [Paraburkholderia bryophila]